MSILFPSSLGLIIFVKAEVAKCLLKNQLHPIEWIQEQPNQSIQRYQTSQIYHAEWWLIGWILCNFQLPPDDIVWSPPQVCIRHRGSPVSGLVGMPVELVQARVRRQSVPVVKAWTFRIPNQGRGSRCIGIVQTKFHCMLRRMSVDRWYWKLGEEITDA